jgi:hypothetical protein
MNDLGLDLSEKLNERKNEEEKEFDFLLKNLNKRLKQAEFDLMHGDYLIKEHCNEIRRQVQLAKETTLLKIEEITDELFTKILFYFIYFCEKSFLGRVELYHPNRV